MAPQRDIHAQQQHASPHSQLESSQHAAMQQLPSQLTDMSQMKLRDDDNSEQQTAPQQPLIQELDSSQTNKCQDLQDACESTSNKQWLGLDRRIQTLEATSRRMERKIDQILEYTRIMAQSLSPI